MLRLKILRKGLSNFWIFAKRGSSQTKPQQRNEKLLDELQPQIEMTQVCSRRPDAFDAQLNQFRRIQASVPTLDVKVNELESQMSSGLSMTPQFEASNSRLCAVEEDVICLKSRLE